MSCGRSSGSSLSNAASIPILVDFHLHAMDIAIQLDIEPKLGADPRSIQDRSGPNAGRCSTSLRFSSSRLARRRGSTTVDCSRVGMRSRAKIEKDGRLTDESQP